MKLNQILTSLVSFQAVLAVAAEDEIAPDEVDEFCRAKNPPQIPIKAGGGWNCMSCAGVPYDDPKTGVAKCCGFRDEFIVDKARPKEGACCKPNQIYSYDPATSKGSCCAPGQVFKNGECSPKKKPSPNPSPEPSPRCPACTNNYACACDGNLGIQYGHCYTMTDVNGLHLNRDVGGTYQSGGDIDNLIFRVCKSTDDCDEDKGSYVADDGTWYLEDQLGSRSGKGAGWFGNRWPHFGIIEPTDLGHKAVEFTGEGFCMYGDCAICLRSPEKGLSAPCPMGTISEKAHIGYADNPNNCKAYRFQEIKCIA